MSRVVDGRGANPGTPDTKNQQVDITTVDEITQRKQLLAAMLIHLNEVNFQLTQGLHNFDSTRGMGEKT